MKEANFWIILFAFVFAYQLIALSHILPYIFMFSESRFHYSSFWFGFKISSLIFYAFLLIFLSLMNFVLIHFKFIRIIFRLPINRKLSTFQGNANNFETITIKYLSNYLNDISLESLQKLLEVKWIKNDVFNFITNEIKKSESLKN